MLHSAVSVCLCGRECVKLNRMVNRFLSNSKTNTTNIGEGRPTLSELVVLEVPGNIVISFPPTARHMIFSRMFTQPSAIAPTSWGRIKQIH